MPENMGGGGRPPGSMGPPDGAGMALEMLVAIGVVAGLLVLGVILVVILLRRAVIGEPGQQIRKAALQGVATQSAVDLAPAPRAAPPAEAEGFIVIPDISGYTQFMRLNRFSLAHAQYTVSRLLEAIIDVTESHLATAKVEGDALLLYGLCATGTGSGGLDGASTGRAVVAILKAFYSEKAALVATNTCPCEACQNIERLDLKIVVHKGNLLLYDLRGRAELSGLALIVAHRLLKNSLGLIRYVLVTEAAHGDVPIELAVTARPCRETYEGVGEVAAYVYPFEIEALLEARDLRPASSLGAKTAAATRKLGQNLRSLRP